MMGEKSPLKLKSHNFEVKIIISFLLVEYIFFDSIFIQHFHVLFVIILITGILKQNQ